MRDLGWRPLRSPITDWPSALALGPYGRLLSAAFVLCGLALPLFATGLKAALAGASRRASSAKASSAKAGNALLAAAGAAMVLLASDTDPTFSKEPPTLHGILHDAAFAALGLTLLPALILLGLRMVRDPRWRLHGFYTLSTALVSAICFELRGVAFYLFLNSVLGWFVVTALRLGTMPRRP